MRLMTEIEVTADSNDVELIAEGGCEKVLREGLLVHVSATYILAYHTPIIWSALTPPDKPCGK
jgi:hypothetical protein